MVAAAFDRLQRNDLDRYHDRYFLDAINGILELDRGSQAFHMKATPGSSWLEAKAKRMEREAKEDKSKQRTLERELGRMRQGAKARQAKSKARIKPIMN